jgi:hypothetical protein
MGISKLFVVDRFVCKTNRTQAALLCIGKNVFSINFLVSLIIKNYFLLLLTRELNYVSGTVEGKKPIARSH